MNAATFGGDFKWASRPWVGWWAGMALALAWLQGAVGGIPPRLQHAMPTNLPLGSWRIQSLGIESEHVITSVAAPPDGSGRLMYADRGGTVRYIHRASGSSGLFLDLTSKVVVGVESGLCSMVFHPGYATNRQFFVSYLARIPGAPGAYMRLSRFEADPVDPLRVLPDSELPLISQLHRGDYHFAGDLRFGPDGYLYMSLGDEGYAHQWDNAGRWDRNFFSAILRMDPDQRVGGLLPNVHPAVHPGTYLVPPDNPFIGRTNYVIGETDLNLPMPLESLRTEFWAVGFRNPWRMSFRPGTSELYANDVGVGQREEVNRVARGGHHGWPWKEGTQPWPFDFPKSGLVDPILEYEHSEGRVAITASWFHDDPRNPYLQDCYLFADWSGPIYATRRLADGRHAPPELLGFQPGIATMAQDPADGAVILAGNGLHVLVREARAALVPPTLSATGLFESVRTLQPAPELIAYDVNQPFWSDRAIKRRWFVLPLGEERVRFDPQRPWKAPPGTAWIKHFDFPIHDGDPGRLRRLETRVLVRTAQDVYGVTYRWNDAQDEALLVPEEGHEEDVPVEAAGGGTRSQRWRYPSRTECRTCHSDVGGPALSFNTAQINRAGPGGTNQVERLARMGCFEGQPDVRPNLLRAHPALDDEAASLEHRVRSYFEVNCGSCHQPGTANRSPWNAFASVPLAQAGLLRTQAIHANGSLYEVFATNIVEPGSPSASVLFRRVSEPGPLHMPPLGTFVLNTNAVALLSAWINGLTNRPDYAEWARRLMPDVEPNDALPGADADGDGDPNEFEFGAGTNPNDPTDRLRLAVVRLSGGGLEARFLRKAHHEYRLETAPECTGPWSAVDHPENRPRRLARDGPAAVPLPQGAEVFVRLTIATP